MKTIKVSSWQDVPENFTGCILWDTRTKWWFLNGQCHREDGPAIEYPDGHKHWYLFDEPATEEGVKLYVDVLRLRVIRDSK